MSVCARCFKSTKTRVEPNSSLDRSPRAYGVVEVEGFGSGKCRNVSLPPRYPHVRLFASRSLATAARVMTATGMIECMGIGAGTM